MIYKWFKIPPQKIDIYQHIGMIIMITIIIIIIVTVVMFAILRAEKEWGDGIRGLALSAARFSLLRFSIFNTIITIIIKTSSIINILNKPSTSPLSTIDIIIKITFDTPQAGRWTPTHKELETSDSQQGRISSAATHIPSKQRSYLFCQQMAFEEGERSF